MVYDSMAVHCRMCGGSGQIRGPANLWQGQTYEPCPGCHGRGAVVIYGDPFECMACGGSGEVEVDPLQVAYGWRAALCSDCGGSGWEGRVA